MDSISVLQIRAPFECHGRHIREDGLQQGGHKHTANIGTFIHTETRGWSVKMGTTAFLNCDFHLHVKSYRWLFQYGRIFCISATKTVVFAAYSQQRSSRAFQCGTPQYPGDRFLLNTLNRGLPSRAHITVKHRYSGVPL